MAWKHLTRSQKEVARRLAHGEGCDYVHDGSWGFFDRFMIFLRGINYLGTLNLDGEGYARRMITIAKLLLTYQARVLLGIDSVNKIPHMLFGDIGLLMTLAYRSKEGEEIAKECIRRYRVKTMAQSRHKCMIVSGDHYGIFDLEELMMLVGQPVRCPMRTDEDQFRKLHGL